MRKKIVLPRSKKILAIQLLLAISIMLLMGAYVWLIQLKYDITAKDAKTWTERIWLPVYYALIVTAAGFSYDCAKTVLYLSEATFKRFWLHVKEAGMYSVVVLVAMIGGTFLLHANETSAIFFGQVFYLAGLITTWFTINSVSNAIEVAATGD